MRTATLLLVAALLACHAHHVPVPTEGPAFPAQWRQPKIDFDVLRAIQSATNDFLPPRPPWVWLFQSEVERCIWSPKALDYYIAEGPDVVFVYVFMDPAHCGVNRAISDAGARYAVRRADGLILRRLWDGEPDDHPAVTGESGDTKDGATAAAEDGGTGGAATDAGYPAVNDAERSR